ncbi:metallophosphoesterase [Paenibacillus thiaminolyticus]|nr:metallophosphoesterase [Paenibacillus thiaminolyticus]
MKKLIDEKAANVLPDGTYKIQIDGSKESKVLQHEGTSAVIAEWAGEQSQKWDIRYQSPNWQGIGGYVIQPANTDRYLAWDRNKGSSVIVSTIPAADIQYTRFWRVEKTQNNTYIFKNNHAPNPNLTISAKTLQVLSGHNYEFTLSTDLNKPIPKGRALVITSDPQYPWTKNTDNNKPESDSEKERESERLIREQYQSINRYNNTKQQSSVIINGDITAFGHSWQRTKMLHTLLPILNRNYYFGLGNHDIENNQGDCADDACFGGSMLMLKSHIEKLGLPTSQYDIKKASTSWSEPWKGSFAYAIDFGLIYSLQLNNFPTMNAYGGSYSNYYQIHENLDWIEANLKYASKLGKTIIVNVHKPNDWKGGPNQRFIDLLEEYDVKAVFAGHYHKSLGTYSASKFFGKVPVFLSGSASQSTYLIVEYDFDTMNVYKVTNNNWEEKKLVKSIKLNNGNSNTYKIVTALNDSSVVDMSLQKNGDVHLWKYDGALNQKWKLINDETKKAYQFKNMYDESLVLAWNDYMGSRNVFATPNQGKDEHYWLLEDTGDGYHILKNKKYPYFVLDVDMADTDNGTNIKVNEQHDFSSPYIKAQKFKLIQV